MKLTRFEAFMYWLGFHYVYNKRSDEIHRLSNKQRNCKLKLMARQNRVYITKRRAERLFAEGSDGCRWCYAEKNTG